MLTITLRRSSRYDACMKLLILGGTSFLGPAIVEDALARGWDVTLFNRGKTNPHLFPDLRKIRGDRMTDDIEKIVDADCDAVIDTSAFFPQHVKSAAEAVRDRARQYVFISSVSAFDGHATVGVTEDAPSLKLADEYAGREDALGFDDMSKDMTLYGACKGLGEVAAEAAMPGRVTNIRPGFIVGPRDTSNRFHYWPWRMHQGGEILAPGPKSVPIQLIDVRDLATFCNQTIVDGHVGLYSATGPAAETPLAELLYACKSVTATPGSLTWVTEEFILEQGAGTWAIPFWVAPSDAASQGLQTVDNRKAIAHGLRFRPLAETARATLEDALGNGHDAEWARGKQMRETETEWLAKWREKK